MSLEAVLRAIDPLPPGALVPVEWLRRELVADAERVADSTPPGPLAGMTVEEVAAELGRSGSTVRGWLLSGALAGFKFGREWRVRRADLVAFMDAQSSSKGDAAQPALGHSGRDRIGAYKAILNGRSTK